MVGVRNEVTRCVGGELLAMVRQLGSPVGALQQARIAGPAPVTLEIGDPKLASIAISGRFRIGDLDAVLDVLQTNFGILAHQVDERSIRLESETHH